MKLKFLISLCCHQNLYIIYIFLCSKNKQIVEYRLYITKDKKKHYTSFCYWVKTKQIINKFINYNKYKIKGLKLSLLLLNSNYISTKLLVLFLTIQIASKSQP